MGLGSAFLFFAIMLGLAMIPSASVALVVVRSASGGLRHGFAVAGGIVLGDLCLILLVVAGLTALAEALGALFVVVRYLAGAYLIWFGFQLLRACNRSAGGVEIPRSGAMRWSGSFAAGFFLTLGDLKAILFYASLLPAFFNLARFTWWDTAIVALLAIVTVGGTKVLYAVFARRLAARFISSGKATALKKGSGLVLVGTGTYLIAKP